MDVRRPNLNPCPPPDKNIAEWIVGDWKKPSVTAIDFKETLPMEVKDDKGDTSFVTEEFFDDDDRVNSFDNWLKKREQWRTVEFPKQKGLTLYNRLFGLYSNIRKEPESVELILGDGHVKWRENETAINHPVLLQKVHIKFNPAEPSFTIYCDDIRTELYTPMLRNIQTVNQSVLADTIQEIEDKGYHIADSQNIAGACKRIINVINEKGKYVRGFESNLTGPTIMQSPVLFLRKRNLGFSIFIDKIIEDIDREDVVYPDFLENMIGNYGDIDKPKMDSEEWNQSGIDEDILLTLPANNEQLRIVKHMDNYGAVLVQGPPGTGKTHTIANLIGHLLSEGKSV